MFSVRCSLTDSGGHLRIYLAVRHSLDAKLYYGGLWSGNFVPALGTLGWEVVESSVDLLPASRFMHVANGFTAEEREARSRITEAIVAEVTREHAKGGIDLFLSYFYNAHFDPSGFGEIRRLGIPTVNFYCNSIYQFDLVEEVARGVDFAWHAERDAREDYLRVGARPVWVQMAADPEFYRPVAVLAREGNACFVGQRYADRDRWIVAVVEAGIPLALYGPGWGAHGGGAGPKAKSSPTIESPMYLGRRATRPGSFGSYLELVAQNLHKQGPLGGLLRSWDQFRYRAETRRLSASFATAARGPIPPTEIGRVFSSHEVVLNLSNVWADGHPGSRLIPHVRLRDFEAPMCRSCYLTGHTDEIAEFYKLGEEIDTYRSRAEFIEKIQFYLSHTDAAERLREAGYRRAIRDHKWTNRFQELLRKIGIR